LESGVRSKFHSEDPRKGGAPRRSDSQSFINNSNNNNKEDDGNCSDKNEDPAPKESAEGGNVPPISFSLAHDPNNNSSLKISPVARQLTLSNQNIKTWLEVIISYCVLQNSPIDVNGKFVSGSAL